MPSFQRDGIGLHYELHGEAEAPPLVLLEGLGGDLAGWRRNLPRLSARFRVLAHDFRGNGRSEMGGGAVSMETYVQDTLALLDELGIERAHLYGVSFGGFVAQLLGLDHRERIGAVVLGATHSGGPDVVRSRARIPKGKPFRALYAPGFPDAHPTHVAEDLIAGAPTRQSPEARRRMSEAARGFDVSGRIHQLASPALVIHGTEDQMIPVDNGIRLAGRILGARLHLLEGAGHMFHSERAEESDRAVIEFLEQVPGE
jgi:pimeloyl-ACP methyl ester carboxylesterase